MTLLGFAITIYNVVRAKGAAELAQKAVAEVRKDVLRIDTVAQFSAALAAMDEIKRLHRQDAWAILPDRYAALRRSLVEIKSANSNIPEHHKSALQNSILHFRGIENQVEESLAKSKSPSNVPKLNDIVSEQIDSLQVVLTEIKNQMGV